MLTQFTVIYMESMPSDDLQMSVSIMTTSRECVCCREVPAMVAKIDELGDTSVACITQHPGFATVCLDVWVLQTAYYQYRQEHGVPASPITLQE